MFGSLSRRSGGDSSAVQPVESRAGVSRRLFVASLAMALAFTAMPVMAKPKPKLPSTMLPLRITNVIVRDGQLIAQGVLGNNTFEAPITLTPGHTPAGADCPILHLMLGPINLNLLGLVVDTSAICLDIDAQPGPGNLLGNLLCGVSHLLDGGLNLGAILGGLTAGELTDLLDGITDLLNAVLQQATSPAAVAGVGGTAAGATDILNLSLGPVDLNLLGLLVSLDNCNGGPVTIDITAVPGPGNLLGNLLGNLAHLLDSSANANALANALNRVADAIGALL